MNIDAALESRLESEPLLAALEIFSQPLPEGGMNPPTLWRNAQTAPNSRLTHCDRCSREVDECSEELIAGLCCDCLATEILSCPLCDSFPCACHPMPARRNWLTPRPDDNYQRIATFDLFDSRWRPHYNCPLLIAVELGGAL